MYTLKLFVEVVNLSNWVSLKPAQVLVSTGENGYCCYWWVSGEPPPRLWWQMWMGTCGGGRAVLQAGARSSPLSCSSSSSSSCSSTCTSCLLLPQPAATCTRRRSSRRRRRLGLSSSELTGAAPAGVTSVGPGPHHRWPQWHPGQKPSADTKTKKWRIPIWLVFYYRQLKVTLKVTVKKVLSDPRQVAKWGTGVFQNLKSKNLENAKINPRMKWITTWALGRRQKQKTNWNTYQNLFQGRGDHINAKPTKLSSVTVTVT